MTSTHIYCIFLIFVCHFLRIWQNPGSSWIARKHQTIRQMGLFFLQQLEVMVPIQKWSISFSGIHKMKGRFMIFLHGLFFLMYFLSELMGGFDAVCLPHLRGPLWMVDGALQVRIFWIQPSGLAIETWTSTSKI